MRQLTSEILRALQARAARSALGPSSMRGAGSRGVVEAGRPVLRGMDLRRFSTSNQRKFASELDRATDGLLRSFPRSARHWGLARKGVNIFLRDCLYTVYLREAFGLAVAEPFFELPLDSLTGHALHAATPDRLPRWRTVRGLDKPISDEFQSVAADIARVRGIARVHLDAIWWGQRNDAGPRALR